MNVIQRRKYTLELDVWEPLQKSADEEIDKLVLYIKANLSHCGYVRFRLDSSTPVV